jgi:hypothetical protein
MRRIEAMRNRIRRLMQEHGHPPQEDKPLSTVTVAWLRRLETALVDEHCSDTSYEEIDRAAFAAVPAEESDELRRRLNSFAQLRDVFPLHARSVDESLGPVLEGLLRVAKAHEKKADG